MIESESGIGAGTRRIEAVTGKAAFEWLKEKQSTLLQIADVLKAKPANVVKKAEDTMTRVKDLEKENESLIAKLGNAQLDELWNQAKEIDGVTVLAAKVEAKNNGALRGMIDEAKQKFPKLVVVFGATDGKKVMLAAGVSKELTDTFKAGDVLNHVATQCDGRGGGRPEMAMGGAKDPSKLDEALDSVYDYIKSV